MQVAVLVTALALSCYSLVLLVAQLVAPRVSIGLAGAVLLALFLLTARSRLRLPHHSAWLSPFRYYELSHNRLSTDGSFDVQAPSVSGHRSWGERLATLAFVRRDLGSR